MAKEDIVKERYEKAIECLKKADHGSSEVAGAVYYNDQPAHMIMYEAMALIMQSREQEDYEKHSFVIT